MHLEKFKRMIATMGKTDLLRVLKNAQAKHASAHVRLVRSELDRRFPARNTPRAVRISGNTPCGAVFRGQKESFSTAKAGFTWLVEKMIESCGKGCQAQLNRLAIDKTKKRKYLARSPEQLFVASPHLADDTNNYSELPFGWYLNVNLSNHYKFDVLSHISLALGFKHQCDWDLIIDANNDDVTDRRRIQKQFEESHGSLLQKQAGAYGKYANSCYSPTDCGDYLANHERNFGKC